MSECTVLKLNDKLEIEDLHLIDVREYAEYAGGRVEGAHLLPLGELDDRHKEIDHTKPVYVMCRTGNRSGQAQDKLRELGYTNVINVKGGFEAWKNENLPFEKDEKPPWDLERQVRMAAGLFVLLGFVLSILVHPYLIGISAFIGAGLVFSSATNTCTMGLILSKMPWNRMPETCAAEVSTAK